MHTDVDVSFLYVITHGAVGGGGDLYRHHKRVCTLHRKLILGEKSHATLVPQTHLSTAPGF